MRIGDDRRLMDPRPSATAMDPMNHRRGALTSIIAVCHPKKVGSDAGRTEARSRPCSAALGAVRRPDGYVTKTQRALTDDAGHAMQLLEPR